MASDLTQLTEPVAIGTASLAMGYALKMIVEYTSNARKHRPADKLADVKIAEVSAQIAETLRIENTRLLAERETLIQRLHTARDDMENAAQEMMAAEQRCLDLQLRVAEHEKTIAREREEQREFNSITGARLATLSMQLATLTTEKTAKLS